MVSSDFSNGLRRQRGTCAVIARTLEIPQRCASRRRGVKPAARPLHCSGRTIRVLLAGA
jgi:hypothetical protein